MSWGQTFEINEWEETKELLLEAQKDEYIEQMLWQEKAHIEKREAISWTVEKKKRELDFLRNLTPDDVIYFTWKKQVYAARIIWVSRS